MDVTTFSPEDDPQEPLHPQVQSELKVMQPDRDFMTVAADCVVQYPT